jgi:hypothetical protein
VHGTAHGGVFRTQQIEVWGFRGTFAGAGMDATVVETLAPLPISPPDLDLAVRFWNPGSGPVFIGFRNAHMTMRDLTVRNDAYLPTVGWTHGGFGIRALAALLWFEGDDLRVDMQRVAVESGPGDLDGLSVLNGVWVQGLEAYPGSAVPDMVGSFTFREGRIDGPGNGLVASNVETFAVAVRDSVITGFDAVAASNVGRSTIEIRGNDLSGRERAVHVVHDQSGRTPLGASTIIVVDNHLRTLGDAGAVAVRVTDAGETPTQFVIVERNVIEIDAVAEAAVAGEAHGLVMRDNVVLGAAPTAVQVGIGGAEAGVPWLVIGNDFGGFTAGDVDVTVSSRARGAVVVCRGPTTVRDDGRGSVVACD